MQGFVSKALSESRDVADFKWITPNIVDIMRTERQDFRAAVIAESLVSVGHVEPFLETGVQVIANFPKIGMWSGDAIDTCEARGIAWGRYGVLLKSLGSDYPAQCKDPKINFARRALSQHNRVRDVGFITDHLLTVHHDTGRTLRVALLYEYDVTPEDIRNARERLGLFDLVLKTNPNGSILEGVAVAAESMGAQVFEIGDMLRHLARLK